jgi:hypothetical protein
MKTKNKQNERKAKATVLALLMLMVIVLPFVSCDEEEEQPDDPVPQSETVNATINGTIRSIRIEGTFKNSEWSDIYGKLSGLTINTGPVGVSKVNSIYSNGEVITIKVVDGGDNGVAGHVITLSLEVVQGFSISELGVSIAGLINSSSFTKAIDNSRNTIRMAKAFVIGNAKSI